MSMFTPVDLGPSFNSTRDPQHWHQEIGRDLRNMPAEKQAFWGIPFLLGPREGRSWLCLDRDLPQADIVLSRKASFLVFAHFCDESHDPEGKRQPKDYNPGEVTRPGEHLADYALLYTDGTEHRRPIRRRFEIGEALVLWGQWAFAARPHVEDRVADWRGPYSGDDYDDRWGVRQVAVGPTPGRNIQYWLFALPNPYPGREIGRLLLETKGAGRIAIAGITLYAGKAHPLRFRRLETLRVSMQQSTEPTSLDCAIEPGVIGRRFNVPPFDGESWLSEPVKGWGDEPPRKVSSSEVLVEAMTTAESTIKVAGQVIDLQSAFEQGSAASPDGKIRVEVLTPHKTWVRAKVLDSETGRPTPARVHFRSPDGRYIPPYGHRHEVNDNWFEDYGGDLKLGSTQYAYVDGDFTVELPVGEVFVEVAKGFEYRPLREKVEIRPGQKELALTIERPINLRRQRWVTADTHVHFLSPQTAWLEAQAEGVNIVNLLASQWGDLFTNFADITGDLSRVSRNETLVWVGTENRQHILGHMSLLGVKGAPVTPVCASGPDESYIGDPTWSSLAEWAERCREQEGLVVIPHFPNPQSEVIADVVLGKVDGLEIRFFTPALESSDVREWYRFLNCGYRIAAVGGTDKMSAGQALGGVRTYAQVDDGELSFGTWAAAVRAGRTFTTSGPLIGLTVDGRSLGDEIRIKKSGGTMEVEAWARCFQPFHDLQIVVNGQIVAEESAADGAQEIRLRSAIKIPGSAWIAARCVSRLKVWQSITAPQPVHIGAHSSPVYVHCEGDELFNPSDATYMLTLIDGGLTWLDTLSIPASPEQHKRIHRIFEEAKVSLEGRMPGHTHTHTHTHTH
jgi:hypothetical protein